jgi:enoyl-CoA hydratase/carnithine racemase
MADRLAELVDVQLASAGVALVTLNLPQVRNAMTTELTAAWTTAMDQVTKTGLAQGSQGGFEVALQCEALAQPVTMATADIHKGIQARREHRPPTFDGN